MAVKKRLKSDARIGVLPQFGDSFALAVRSSTHRLGEVGRNDRLFDDARIRSLRASHDDTSSLTCSPLSSRSA